MKSSNLTLGEVLASPNQYVIPVFQRYYRWGTPQWEKLWTDLGGLEEPGKTGRHFMGFLVIVPESVAPGQVTRYHLIDGQQRLTTLSLVLCALRDAARAAGVVPLAREIEDTTLVHPYRKGEARFRVFPKLQDREDFVACLDGRPPAEGRIAAAVRFFADRLATIPEAGTEAGLRAFLDLLTGRLEFVYALLEGENPFNIFKSLNSTGVPLGPSDLIRNFVFMHVPVGEQDEFDAKRWRPIERRFPGPHGGVDADAFSAFLRDHLMRHGEYVPPAETFEAFQRRYEATAFAPPALADELAQAAGWHAIVRGEAADPSPGVEAALALLRPLESATTYPLLLNLYARRERGQMSDAELAEAVRWVAGFVLRRLVCGEGSRGYARLFVQAAAVLGASPLDDLKRYLEARGFPDTPRFHVAFVRFKLYASRYAKAVLDALERSFGHKEPADTAGAQVEHVLPQKLTAEWRAALGEDAGRVHEAWLHTPGNLTLTGYNVPLSNKPFAEKKQIYADSHFAMTKPLAGHATWGAAEIETRGRALAKRAAAIWPGPAEPVRSAPDEPETKGSRFAFRVRFWEAFRRHVEETGSNLKPDAPAPRYYLRCGRIAVGTSLYAFVIVRDQYVSVAAYFNGKRGRAALRAIQGRPDVVAAIEAGTGAKVAFTRSRELVVRRQTDPRDAARWPADFAWMVASLGTIREVLAPHVGAGAGGDGGGHGGGIGNREESRKYLLSYWTAFRDHVLQGPYTFKPRKPSRQHWTSIASGRTGVTVEALAIRKDGTIRVELNFYDLAGRALFDALRAERAAVEMAVGEPLEWVEHPGQRRGAQARLVRPANPGDQQTWPEQHAWLASRLQAMHDVCLPRIKGYAIAGHDAAIDESQEPDAGLMEESA